jgi:hypothetical protein
MRILCFVALTALLIPAVALGQEPERIRPGTPLDTTFIRAGADSITILMEHEGDTMQAAIAVIETRLRSDRGVRQVVLVQRLVVAEEDTTLLADSAYLHWRTLLPVSAHTRGDIPYDYFFGPSGVSITALRDSTMRAVALDSPVFYLGSQVLLLRALPLRVGYRAVLPILTEAGAPGEMHVAVTGEERVRTLDGGACNALVVRVGEGDFEVTYRIDAATRQLVRIDSEYSLAVRATGCP